MSITRGYFIFGDGKKVMDLDTFNSKSLRALAKSDEMNPFQLWDWNFKTKFISSSLWTDEILVIEKGFGVVNQEFKVVLREMENYDHLKSWKLRADGTISNIDKNELIMGSLDGKSITLKNKTDFKYEQKIFFEEVI